MVGRHPGFVMPEWSSRAFDQSQIPYRPSRSGKTNVYRTTAPMRQRTYTTPGRTTTAVAVRRRKRKPRRVPGPYLGGRYSKTRKISYSVPHGTGSTFSRYQNGTKRMSKEIWMLFKQNQEFTRTVLSSQRITSAYGGQGIDTRPRNLAVQLNDMVVNIPTIALPETSRMYLGSTMSKLTFTNQDISTCYVQMYEIEPRFHSDATEDPVVLWDEGYEDSGSTLDTYVDAYQSPFLSHKFCLFWKVNKIIKFELQQGQSHCHTAMYHINRAVHGAITQKFTHFRDISRINMVVVSGTPINDATNEAAVSTSSCAVDIVESITTNFTFAAATNVFRSYANNLDAIVQGQTVSIGSGEIQNDDDA